MLPHAVPRVIALTGEAVASDCLACGAFRFVFWGLTPGETTVPMFTVFCVDKNDPKSTVWIEAVEAQDRQEAMHIGRTLCACAWEFMPIDIHVLGVAEGDVTILHWDDDRA